MVQIIFIGVGEAGVIADTLADKPGGVDGRTQAAASGKIVPLTIKGISMNKLLAQQGNGRATVK